MPDDYLAPPMQWFRGLTLDVYQRQSQFIVHGQLDIGRDPASAGSGGGGILGKLPSINLFKGFSKVEEIEPGRETPPRELPADKQTDKK